MSTHSVGLLGTMQAVDYDTLAWSTSATEFAEGTPVVVKIESASRKFVLKRSDTSAEIPSLQLSKSTSAGWQKLFIMPDCDVTIETGSVTPSF